MNELWYVVLYNWERNEKRRLAVTIDYQVDCQDSTIVLTEKLGEAYPGFQIDDSVLLCATEREIWEVLP